MSGCGTSGVTSPSDASATGVAPDAPVDGSAAPCPSASAQPPTNAPFDCTKAWQQAEGEADAIINRSDDPIQRNKYINAAYAQLYRQDPRLHWLGAAAFASKQVVCGLQEAKQVSDLADAQMEAVKWGAEPDPITQLKGGYAKAVYDALKTGNRNVFKDVYPAHVFYERNGLTHLRECAGTRRPPLDDKVLQGFSDIDAGHSADGAMKILQHEQLDILQTRDVFGNQEMVDIMGRNQWWSDVPVLGPLLGAQKTSVSYTPNCGGDPSVTFTGKNPADPNERWPYAQKVVQKFEDLISNPTTNQKLQSDLGTIIGEGK